VTAAAAAAPPAHHVARLGERLHLQEGPIDLVVDAFGPASARTRAFGRADAAFDGLLAGLARHLAVLRRPVDDRWPADASPTALRMRRAVASFGDHFVTPMAAVAGAVADTVSAALREVDGLDAAYVNNRGDIALFVTPRRPLEIGVVTAVREAGIEAGLHVDAASGVGGIATSGWDGRSFSLGIADAVTVLAADAATADVAATLLANAVDTDDPAVSRTPAHDLDPDSDLGSRPVTTAVGPLAPAAVDAALGAGRRLAEDWVREGRILGALIAVQGRGVVCGDHAHAVRAADRGHALAEAHP
jgi:ApbE superfamily uncharacterized protein (UPF0280 family)